jgi:hypothetical protein
MAVEGKHPQAIAIIGAAARELSAEREWTELGTTPAQTESASRAR